MTESVHTHTHTRGTYAVFNAFVYTLSHLCGINQFHFYTVAPLSVILDQFVWIASPNWDWKGPVLESQVFAITPTTSSLDLRLPVFSLTAGRYLSDGSPSVSADIVLPLFCDTDLSALIYQAPSCHYSQSVHSHDTVVTELEGGERCWRERVGRTETKMMNAVSFIRCISAEHEIFSLYMNVQCHFLLPACLCVHGRNFSSRCGFSCMNGWCAPQRDM